MVEHKELIPDCYIWLSNNNKTLFKRYVSAYIERNAVGYKLVRIEDKGRVAVCVRKGE